MSEAQNKVKTKTYTLDVKTIEYLTEMSNEDFTSRSQFIRKLVHNEYNKRKKQRV